MTSGIYGIININNGKMYIGSAIDFEKRRCEHLRKLRRNCHHSRYLQNAWNKYGEDHFKFSLLERVEPSELITAEQRFIDGYGMVNLYNVNPTAGSNLGRHWTEETKEKLRKAVLGRYVSQETRKKMSRASLGRRLSLEAKKKISDANHGRKPSEETRARISEALKKVFSNPEIKEKLRNRPPNFSMLGKHHTQETCQKLSEQRRGEQNSMFGRHHTEETKNKIRYANAKLTWTEVDEIRRLWDTGEVSQAMLARQYGVSKGCIQGIVDGVNWKKQP